MDKFKNVKVDEDTYITQCEYIKIKNIDCRHEHWRWDGVTAQSLIILSSDAAQFSEEEISDLCLELKSDPDAEITISEKGEYIFINFNFE